jgi:hypothetical protein
MKCEICGEDATVHVTEVHDDRDPVQRRLCDRHALEAGLPMPTAEQSATEMVAKLRSLATFIRTNNRMSRPDEMAQQGAAGDLTETLPGTADFDRQVTYLEDFATFIEQNGRPPTDQEMPDPF